MAFEPNVKRKRLSWSIIVASLGAVIVLISLAIPWYEVREPDGWFDVGTKILLRVLDGIEGTLWIGFSLPVYAVIVFASATLLSVIYCLVKGKEAARFWGWLGILTIGCLIGNALYLWKWAYDEFTYGGMRHDINIVNYGIIVAFIGAVIMALSHPYIRKLFSLISILCSLVFTIVGVIVFYDVYEGYGERSLLVLATILGGIATLFIAWGLYSFVSGLRWKKR